jgi:hypothetical protein
MSRAGMGIPPDLLQPQKATIVFSVESAPTQRNQAA